MEARRTRRSGRRIRGRINRRRRRPRRHPSKFGRQTLQIQIHHIEAEAARTWLSRTITTTTAEVRSDAGRRQRRRRRRRPRIHRASWSLWLPWYRLFSSISRTFASFVRLSVMINSSLERSRLSFRESCPCQWPPRYRSALAITTQAAGQRVGVLSNRSCAGSVF